MSVLGGYGGKPLASAHFAGVKIDLPLQRQRQQNDVALQPVN